MAKSQGLRGMDIKAAFRLLMEVRERWDDPLAGSISLLQGLCDLIGASSAFAVEAPIPLNPENAGMENLAAVGWNNPKQREVCNNYIREQKIAGDPSIPTLMRFTGRSVSLTREQLVDLTAWYRSDHVNIIRRSADSDAFIVTQQMMPWVGKKRCIIISRPWRERAFETRQRRIVRLVHAELGRLWLRDFQEQTDSPINRLSPRLRQTLELLCQGDSEKQIAAKLSLSRHSVHNSVKCLHRHLHVSTRGELLALALRCRRCQ